MKALSFMFALLLMPACQLQAADKPSQLVIGQVSDAGIETRVTKILKKAYSNLGIELIIKRYPSKRSLVLSNHGIIDGELFRIKTIGSLFTNLRVVPVPIFQGKTALYTINGKTELNSLQPILASTIAIQRGVHWQEQAILPKTKGITRVQTKALQFEMLALARVQYVVSEQEPARVIIERDFPHAGIKQVSLPLKPLKLFHVLHQRHQALIPALTAQITKILAAEKASAIEQAAQPSSPAH